MAVTTWDDLKLRRSDVILKWMVGESRRLRIIDGAVYEVRKHWVTVKDENGDDKPMPFVCLGADCGRVLLPDGSVLHDADVEIERRCFVWDWTLGGELRILAGKTQIFDGIKSLHRKFSDLTSFDIEVSCEPAKGIGGRKYTVSAVPGTAAELTGDILERIADDMPNLMSVIDPLPLGIDDVAQHLGAQVLYPTEDESLADSEPAETEV